MLKFMKKKFKYLLPAIILFSAAQTAYADTRVEAAQQKLLELGYNPGIKDGVWSKETEAANEWLTFKYNIHDSLPTKWVSEFDSIMEILRKTLPIEKSIDQRIKNSTFNIYAWNSKIKDPFGRGMAGACLCGDGRNVWMVLEINKDEFKYRNLHRYSVIIHEYFHLYQSGLSDDNMQPKWLVEGGAKVLEEMVTLQYYGGNALKGDLVERVGLWSDKVFTDPHLYEKYNTSSGRSGNADMDGNYAGSAFMLLALVDELQKEGKSEKEAFRLVFKEFWVANRSKSDWKAAFAETFEMSVDDFYTKLSSYSRRDSRKILPSRSLKIQDIFK